MCDHDKKRLLIISGKDSSVSEIPKFNIHTTLFQQKDLISDLQIKNCDEIYIFNQYKRKKLLDRAKFLHKETPFDAVVSFYEPYLVDAAIIGETLNIRCNPYHAVYSSRNKTIFRKQLENTEFGNIKFQACNSLDTIDIAVKAVGVPCIIKPVTGAGSSGVFLVEDTNDIKRAIKHLQDLPNWAKLDSSEFIVEEYIAGNEFSVESITINGEHKIINVTEKFTSGSPHYIEYQHITPALISNELSKNLSNAASLILDNIKHYYGPAHTEFKVNKNQVYVIETQTRFGGDQIWEMTLLTKGINPAASTIANLVDQAHPQYQKKHKFMAIHFFIFNDRTIIKSINPIKANNIIRSKLKYKPGDVAKPTIDSATRGGYIMFGSDCKKELTDSLNKVNYNKIYEE